MAEKRALVLGASGQDGPWVAQELHDAGYVVHGTYLTTEPDSPALAGRIAIDLADPHTRAHGLIESTQPSIVVFLAGRSSVSGSWVDPAATMAANLSGYARILEAVRDVDPSIRVLHASSSEMFGDAGDVIDEFTPMRPNSPYAESKAQAHVLGCRYRDEFGLNVANAILSNHESIRRPLPYVFRRISAGVAALACGLAAELALGDLSVIRDWGHAPEYARAMSVIANAPDAGDFVVATGVSVSLRDVVEAALATAGLEDRWDLIRLDPALARSGSSYAVRANPSRIGQSLGWKSSDSAVDVIATMVRHDLEVVALSLPSASEAGSP